MKAVASQTRQFQIELLLRKRKGAPVIKELADTPSQALVFFC